MAPDQSRKGFTLVPPGQHPGVKSDVPAPAPDNADGIVITTDSSDQLLRRAIMPPVAAAQTQPEFTQQSQPEPAVASWTEPNAPAQTEPEPIIYDDDDDDAGDRWMEDPTNQDLLAPKASAPRPSEFSNIAHRVASDMQKMDDANRQTTIAKFIAKFASDPSAAVDMDLRQKIDAWIICHLSDTATAETSIKDVGFAISEHGAQLVIDEKELRTTFQNLSWLRSYSSIIDILGLTEFKSVLMLAEIDKTIGRARNLEEEQNNVEQQKYQENVDEIISSVRSLNLSIKALISAQQVNSSPFLRNARNTTPAAQTQPQSPNVAAPAQAE
jgi:hypothetical protein